MTGDPIPPPHSGVLRAGPELAEWKHWTEWDARAWPERKERAYQLVPTVCFNCEAACGLVAFVDKSTGAIAKLEGHPLHPASRCRNCAKGPATLAQVQNPDRILYPLRRVGPRGSGRWERVTWEAALDDLAARIREELLAGRRDRVVYHVGRPGEDLYTERVLATWGVDGHNSHTNVCSAAARAGYAFWMGMDRPMPDHERARFLLMLSSHLEAGHYFNPQAQRIIEAQASGRAKLCVIDTRLSNSAAKADYWLAPWPGTEAALLLAIASFLIREDRCDWEFVRRWTNWRQLLGERGYLATLRRNGRIRTIPAADDFDAFKSLLAELYAPYTFAAAAEECGVAEETLQAVAQEVAAAGSGLATHVWRNAAAGNRGGWMVARCLFLLNVLTGSVGSEGGTLPNQWTKFVPQPHSMPAPVQTWNETLWPAAWPLAHFELSFLLPHLLRSQEQRIGVYFTRVYNPVWTNPDGFAWIDLLSDERRIGLHAALTPVWSESAQYADYVLPMGLGPERHDLHSYETHAAQWVGFRQPVQRVVRADRGEAVDSTLGSNAGEVWEENEFWIELSWRIDPDGALGIRRHFASPYRPGARITIEEYYRWIFEHSVPGLPEAAAAAEASPLQFMRERGAFEVTRDVYRLHEQPVDAALAAAATRHDSALWTEQPPPKVNFAPIPGPFRDAEGRVRIGIVDESGTAVQGFPTPSGKLEFFSSTLNDWGWPECAIPFYPLTPKQREETSALVSQVHPSQIDTTANEYVLLPTFRLPTLIHSRTNGAKWLHELAHVNPVWIHPQDAARVGVTSGELVRVETAIGSFVDRCWVTEALRPGVVACSHHLGRWRLQEEHGSDRWNSSLVSIEQEIDQEKEIWRMRRRHGAGPFQGDRDSARIWWSDGGVHQNLTFPVQPDPISGQHCWHQKVRLRRATEDAYGEITVDQAAARRVYEDWLALTRFPTAQRERRPYWLLRPLKPHPDAYRRDAAP